MYAGQDCSVQVGSNNGHLSITTKIVVNYSPYLLTVTAWTHTMNIYIPLDALKWIYDMYITKKNGHS